MSDNEFGAAQLASCGLLDDDQQLVLNPIQFRDPQRNVRSPSLVNNTNHLVVRRGFPNPGTSIISSPLPCNQSSSFINLEALT